MAGLPGPGDRIEARCTRCNDVTGHVIVALVGGEIVKVECCACGSVHKYYPPVAARQSQAKDSICRVRAGSDRKEAVSAAKPAPSAPSATRSHISKTQKAVLEIEQAWQRSMNQTLAEARPYSMHEHFAVGDVIEHPKFGTGVVQELLPPDKMQILFRDGNKLLRCSC